MLQTLLQVQTHGTSVVSSWAAGRPGLPICSSWGQAVQYLDYRRVHKVCILPGYVLLLVMQMATGMTLSKIGKTTHSAQAICTYRFSFQFHRSCKKQLLV